MMHGRKRYRPRESEHDRKILPICETAVRVMEGVSTSALRHIPYPPPPCPNGKCSVCGHTHCGVCWCQNGSAISGGEWSVVCAGANKCHDTACDFCTFLMAVDPRNAPGSTRVCCVCGRGHPKVTEPDPSSPSTIAKYLPDASDRANQEHFVAVHNEKPQREKDFQDNHQCMAPQGCTNFGFKTTSDGLRVCNACFQSMNSRS